MKHYLHMALVTFIALNITSCGDPADGLPGAKGDKGDSGVNGTNGLDGEGCSVLPILAGLAAPYGGALLTCGGTQVVLLNGEPGPQGEPGPVSPYQLSEIIDPCGDAAGIYDEVILKMASGRLLASFSDNANGNNTRLSELVPGSYITTDGSNCYFTVASNGSVSW